MTSKTPLEQANALFQAGQLDEALEAYEALLSNDTDDAADIYHAIAIIHAHQHDYHAALSAIDKAIHKDSHQAMLYNTKGNIYNRLKDTEAAIRNYNLAIKTNPNYAPSYNNLGNCLYQQKKWSAAEKAFRKAIEKDKNFGDAIYNLSLLLGRDGHIDDAISLLEQLVKKDNLTPKILGQLGEFYLEKNQPKNAIPLFEKRLQLQPKHTETHHSLGQAYALTDELETAIAHYQETLSLDPKHEEVYHNLATATLQAGDPNKALNYYIRQLALFPKPETYYNIGVLYMYQEKNKDALQYLKQAAERDPHHLPTQLNIASIYLKMQRIDDAIHHYEKAQSLAPEDKEIQYILSALRAGELPDRAPDKYLKNLFNQYAHYYDEHLTKYLNYDVPNQMLRVIFNETGKDRETEWRILDLGCGTGLSGAAFRPMASELIGIDLSEEMVSIARKKSIYHTLKVQEIQDALSEYHHLDLIIAADVFSYIGDLSDIFTKAYQSLKKHGLFCFSVERGTDENYTLQKTLRYSHSRQYIERQACNSGFVLKSCETIPLRKQQKQTIEGYLVLLQK